MKVLVISDYRDTVSVRSEAAIILGLKKAGVDIDVITYPGTAYDDAFKEAGITVYPIHPDRKFDRAFIRRLRILTREKGYQIFYLFNSQAIINGITAAYTLPVKVVLYRGYSGNIHWYDPTAYFKYLNPRVDKISCVANSTRDHVRAQMLFHKDKAVTINKGHDPVWYAGVDPLDLSLFGIPAGSFVVACMGNARPFKGIRYLLEASYQLDQIPDLYILLIGRDMDKEPLHSLREDSPMKERILVTGWRSDVLAIMASCHAFVLPSIGGEAMTKALIEAMSMGLPPIITDIPGNEGIVIHEENGLVIPPRDPVAIASAVKQLYQDRELGRKYGQESKKHLADKFHTDRTVVETKQMFEELLTG